MTGHEKQAQPQWSPDEWEQRYWRLTVGALTSLRSWEESARRLVGALDALSEAVRHAYGRTLTWHSTNLGTHPWSDPQSLARRLELMQSEQGIVSPSFGTCTPVQGYLADPPIDWRTATCFLNVEYEIAPHKGLLGVLADFLNPLLVHPLYEHEPSWLCELMCTTLAPISGTDSLCDSARITTGAWDQELNRRRPEPRHLPDLNPPPGMGEVSYLRSPVDPSLLPPSLIAYPQPGDKATIVMLRDLSGTLSNPADLMDDVFSLSEHLPSLPHQPEPG